VPSARPIIDDLLETVRQSSASDLHLKVGSAPVLRVDGDLRVMAMPALDSSEVERYLDEMLPDHLATQFKETSEADFAYGPDGLGRFRVNAFRQRGMIGIAIRALVPPENTFEELGLPPVFGTIAAQRRGLVLVTGPTGSGKTTTLATLLDSINSTRRVNIVTIEDPIEVVHQDKMSIISQRQVGDDTKDFAEAVRRSLRQDPDVIMIGEMRDMETIDAALKASETGHLVLSSLHTLDAVETINRILDFFPDRLQRQVRLVLSGSLRAVISQRLLRKADGSGRVPAVEVLVNTERARERIIDPVQTSDLHEVIAEGAYYGMETFDQAILRLLASGTVTPEEAMRNASRPADLKVRAQQAGILAT